MNCKVVAFYNEDLESIDPVAVIENKNKRFYDEGPAITILVNNIIVACLGVAPIFKGSVVAWCFIDKNIQDNHKRRVVLTCKKELERGMERFSFHRVQADIEVGFDIGKRFVEFLGFKSEGVMRAYGPDKKDYERFALVRY